MDNVFRGMGSVGSAGYVPESSLFYNEDVVKYEYDPELAKERLAGAGFEISLLTDDSADGINIAEIVRNDLEAAGTVSYTHLAEPGHPGEDPVLEYALFVAEPGSRLHGPPEKLRVLLVHGRMPPYKVGGGLLGRSLVCPVVVLIADMGLIARLLHRLLKSFRAVQALSLIHICHQERRL